MFDSKMVFSAPSLRTLRLCGLPFNHFSDNRRDAENAEEARRVFYTLKRTALGVAPLL
jgi:hypothetical protein